MTMVKSDLLEVVGKLESVHNVRLMWDLSSAEVGDDAMCGCCLNDRSSSRCFHIGHVSGDHNCCFSLVMSDSPRTQCFTVWAP